jgi:S-adenosylmethionine:tRNA ribosyltransferase-isomerase
MAKSSKGLKIGAKVSFDKELVAQVVERDGEYYKITLSHPVKGDGGIENLLEEVALTPLPPYIDREPFADDRLRYQTVYARVTGAVAAPTAGLHFTSEILDGLNSKGVEVAYVTLHTGPGTFKPVREANIKDHKMHTEEYSIDEGVFDEVRCAKKEGRRVVAVGTTSTRTLEAAVAGPGGFDEPALSGETGIFIYPGFKFQVVDALLTNFHLPRSTLIMLVSAFATKELIFKAYEEAIEEGYRFFSYGDCMLIT